MPQDSLRSIVYRSFVTCDDPKGVVECRTIKRSETGSETMEYKDNECRRKAKNRSNVNEEMVSNGAAIDELHNSSSCQLLEVSRRAHKLNHVIDSFSNGLWCDGNSKDLLRGALDLQDSLHMLGKLQEVSHYMSKLNKKKKKEKEKWDRARDDQEIQRTNSSPFGERNYQMDSRNPRLSADGSSRDCIEELRKVITDSLARQNLLSNAEEKRCFSGRYPDSASDIPSTSSSHSSTIRTDNFTFMDSSISLPTPEKKARGTSLIAKLMGLEEMPSKPLRTNSQEELESKKIFNQQKHTIEINRPKVKQSEFVFRKEDRKRRTMKDILETMHFKGLLKSNFFKEIKYDSHQLSDIFYEQKLINNSLPIVLIKPRHAPHLQPEEKFVPLFQEEVSLKTDTMLKQVKLKVREEPPSMELNNRGHNTNETRARTEAEEAPVKRLSSREGAKDARLSTKMKTSGPVTMPLLKKEATHERIEKISKPVISSTKLVNKEVPKAKNLLRSKDSKLENGSNVTKNKMSHQRTATGNSYSSRGPQTIVRSPYDRKRSPTKKEKTINKATTTAKIINEKLENKSDGIVLDGKKIGLISEIATVSEGKMIDLAPENNTSFEGNITEIAYQLLREEKTEQNDMLIGEYHDNYDSYVSDVESIRKSIGDTDDDSMIPIGTDSESIMKGTKLKALLLSSPAFLNHADDLFHLQMNIPTASQKFDISDFTDANTRLSLDCATEIVRLRSLPDSQMVRPPLLSVVGNANKIHTSLDHLLKETCDGVEALRSYTELSGGESYPTGRLYSMLERDLKHNEVLSGIWDLGWKKGCSVNDTIQVVNDIEKQLLSGLIEEICA